MISKIYIKRKGDITTMLTFIDNINTLSYNTTMQSKNNREQFTQGRPEFTTHSAVAFLNNMGRMAIIRQFNALQDTNLAEIWVQTKTSSAINRDLLEDSGSKNTSLSIELGAGIAYQVIKQQIGEQSLHSLEITSDNIDEAQRVAYSQLIPGFDESIPNEDILDLAVSSSEIKQQTKARIMRSLLDIDPFVYEVIMKYKDENFTGRRGRRLTESEEANMLLGAFDVANILNQVSQYKLLKQSYLTDKTVKAKLPLNNIN